MALSIIATNRDPWPLDALVKKYQEVLRSIPVKSMYDRENDQLIGDRGTDYEVLQHVKYMLDHMLSMKDPRKYERWLGFVQGTFFMMRMYTLDDLREHVRTSGASL